MRQPISFLTQSRFHSPAFNAAIFDGPVRIYFAQYQESLALKVYFVSQQRLKNVMTEVRDAFRKTGVNVFVMLYPSEEAFCMSFADQAKEAELVVDRLGADFVVGVRGPLTDTIAEKISDRIEGIAKAITLITPVELLQPKADEAVI